MGSSISFTLTFRLSALLFSLALLLFLSSVLPPNFVPRFTFAFVSPRITSHFVFSYGTSKDPVSWSLYFISVCPARYLALALSLRPPPFSIPWCFCTCPRVLRGDRRFIKVSRRRSICPLLNDCPGEGANISSYRTWSAALTRSYLSLRT